MVIIYPMGSETGRQIASAAAGTQTGKMNSKITKV